MGGIVGWLSSAMGSEDPITKREWEEEVLCAFTRRVVCVFVYMCVCVCVSEISSQSTSETE
jgi:hypothetical protein